MARRDELARELAAVAPGDLEAWLLERSGLPGPRANLELMAACADVLPVATLEAWAGRGPSLAPTGTALEFLPCCGVLGLGRALTAAGEDGDAIDALVETLLDHARDPRWRVRETVAMALQRWGLDDFDRLLPVLDAWARDADRLVQRAAVAAACEPPLLQAPEHAVAVLDLLDTITSTLVGAPDRGGEPWRVLRKALAYGWSVAVAAAPAPGRKRMERWLASPDADVRWVMRENLRKARLARMDGAWVARWSAQLGT